MPACSAYGCTTRDYKQNVTFHRYPLNEVMRQKWVYATRRPNFTPSKTAVLCSRHFKEEDFDRTHPHYIRIKKGVVPSVFEGFSSHLQNAEKKARKAPVSCEIQIPFVNVEEPIENEAPVIKVEPLMETEDSVVNADPIMESEVPAIKEEPVLEAEVPELKAEAPLVKVEPVEDEGPYTEAVEVSSSGCNNITTANNTIYTTVMNNINHLNSMDKAAPSILYAVLASGTNSASDSETAQGNENCVPSLDDESSLFPPLKDKLPFCPERDKLQRRLSLVANYLIEARKKIRALQQSKRRLQQSKKRLSLRNDQLKNTVDELRKIIRDSKSFHMPSISSLMALNSDDDTMSTDEDISESIGSVP